MADDNLAKVIEALRDRKISDLKNELTALKNKQAIDRVDLMAKLEEEQSEVKIQTGTLVDELIGGGLSPKTSMLLYGEYGAGKTQTCFTMAVECPDDVLYVDAEGSFRAERIKQICDERGKDFKEVFKKIHLFQPENWVQQMRCIYSFPAPPDAHTGKIGLIIIDSLTKEFRGIEFAGRQTLTQKQPLIREFAFKMGQIVKEYGAALIFTTQVYEEPNQGIFSTDWDKFKAVGGSSLLHQPDFVLCFRRVQNRNIRIVRMMDSSWKPLGERLFVITERGIDDLPEESVAREAILKRAEKFEKQQEMEKHPQLGKKRKKQTAITVTEELGLTGKVNTKKTEGQKAEDEKVKEDAQKIVDEETQNE